MRACVSGHWGIENGMHGMWDGALREDASRIRKGSAPQVVAILRNITILTVQTIGAQERGSHDATLHNMCKPEESLEALSTSV